MNDSIGVVASGSTRYKMMFYSKKEIRTDYVTITNFDGSRTVFEIKSIDVINNRLIEPEFIRFYEVGDDYTKYNIYRAEATPVSTLSGTKSSTDRYSIAAPGSYVFIADNEDIALVNDVMQEKGRTNIGRLYKCPNVPVYVDLDNLLKTHVHLAIVGRTGCGKSYFSTRFLKNLRMKYIVFSPTDEYSNIRGHEDYYKDNIVLKLNLSQIKKLLDLNNSEFGYLNEYIKNSLNKEYNKSDKLSLDIAEYYKKDKNNQLSILGMLNSGAELGKELPQYVTSLCRKVEHINLNFTLNISSDPEIYNSSVYNFQGLSRTEEEWIIYNTLSPLLEEREKKYKSEQTIPEDKQIAIVIEESHNYAPSNRTTLCKQTLVDIARVGRKYGLHLILISQRPRFIDQTILSQCSGGVFFNLPNPDDCDYIMSSASLYRSSLDRTTIQNLGVGQCLIAKQSLNDILCNVSFD